MATYLCSLFILVISHQPDIVILLLSIVVLGSVYDNLVRKKTTYNPLLYCPVQSFSIQQRATPLLTIIYYKKIISLLLPGR